LESRAKYRFLPIPQKKTAIHLIKIENTKKVLAIRTASLQNFETMCAGLEGSLAWPGSAEYKHSYCQTQAPIHLKNKRF
jgi:hypothetical protein